MSKYTTEVRFICENYAGLDKSADYSGTDKVISKARKKVFDFDFPMFDESYRTVLETKILKHYYTREIGFETVSLWKFWLDKRLNEIMPFYNQMYKSELLDFNPFYDVDLTTDSKRNVVHDEETTATGTDKNVRTDALKMDSTGSKVRTDELREDTTDSSTRTDNLKATSSSTGKVNGSNSSTTNTNDTRTDDLRHNETTQVNSDTLSAYSDTPQGSLQNVKNLTYLTNATDTTVDSQTYVTGSNQGTQKNDGKSTTNGSEESNSTLNGTVSNTGTQGTESTGSKVNTGTQKTETVDSVTNSGTQTNVGESSDSGTKDYTNVDDYLEHVKGKRGSKSYMELLLEYRKTFLNIDMMIIEELSDLFMQLW